MVSRQSLLVAAAARARRAILNCGGIPLVSDSARKMKIVIIGAGGRVGAALVREFGAKFDLASFNHAQLDLSKLDDLRRPSAR